MEAENGCWKVVLFGGLDSDLTRSDTRCQRSPSRRRRRRAPPPVSRNEVRIRRINGSNAGRPDRTSHRTKCPRLHKEHPALRQILKAERPKAEIALTILRLPSRRRRLIFGVEASTSSPSSVLSISVATRFHELRPNKW